MTDDPTVAAVLSRCAALPVRGETTTFIGGILRTRPAKHRHDAMEMLERMYLVPGIDAGGYRREKTVVCVHVVNDLPVLTLVSPGSMKLAVKRGATAREPWTLQFGDDARRDLRTVTMPDLGTLAGVLRNHSGGGSAPAAVGRTIHDLKDEDTHGMVATAAAVVGAAVAVMAIAAQLVVSPAGVPTAVEAGMLAGLMAAAITAALFALAITWAKAPARRGPPHAETHDTNWDALRTRYDEHGIRIEGLRSRAATALLAFGNALDTDEMTLEALLGNSLSRLSTNYTRSLAMGVPRAEMTGMETRIAETLETVVRNLELHAAGQRTSRREEVEAIAAHVHLALRPPPEGI